MNEPHDGILIAVVFLGMLAYALFLFATWRLL